MTTAAIVFVLWTCASVAAGLLLGACLNYADNPRPTLDDHLDGVPYDCLSVAEQVARLERACRP